MEESNMSQEWTNFYEVLRKFWVSKEFVEEPIFKNLTSLVFQKIKKISWLSSLRSFLGSFKAFISVIKCFLNSFHIFGQENIFYLKSKKLFNKSLSFSLYYELRS